MANLFKCGGSNPANVLVFDRIDLNGGVYTITENTISPNTDYKIYTYDSRFYLPKGVRKIKIGSIIITVDGTNMIRDTILCVKYIDSATGSEIIIYDIEDDISSSSNMDPDASDIEINVSEIGEVIFFQSYYSGVQNPIVIDGKLWNRSIITLKDVILEF